MNELANTLISGLNSIGPWFWQYASAMLIQSSILIALLFIIDYLILRKRTRAVFRYFLWMLILIKLVLPPSLTTPASIGYLFGDLWQVKSEVSEIRKIPISYTQKQSYAYAVPTLIQKSVIPEEPEFQPSSPTKTVDSEPRLQPINWQGLVFLVWYAGVFVFAVLLLQRAWFVKGLLRQGKEARADLKEILDDCCKKIRLNHRNIELKISANMVSPAVCGIFKHTILLPGFLVDKLSTKQLQNVIIHELAHIKRRDLPVNLIQTILQIVYFYNPLLWLANAIIRRVREQAVDEMVLVTLDKNAPDYSHTLIDIAEMAFHRPSLSLRLIGVVESKKALSGRIKHIVSRPLPKSAKLGIFGMIAIFIIAAIMLPMAECKLNSKENIETLSGEKKDVIKDKADNSDKEFPKITHGIIKDKQSRPIPNSRVILFYKSRTWGLEDRILEETQSKSDGTFVFNSPLEFPYSINSKRTSYIIMAIHQDYAVGWHEVHYGKEQDSYKIILTEPKSHTITVTDHDDNPLEGVWVWPYDIGDRKGAEPLFRQSLNLRSDPGFLGGTTDIKGKATITNLPKTRCSFHATLKGYARGLAWPGGTHIRLSKGANVSGIVLTKDGHAVENAIVRFSTNWMWQFFLALTDNQGRFHFEDIPAKGWDMSPWGNSTNANGAYKVTIKHEKFTAEEQKLQVEPGQIINDFNIQVIPGTLVRVKVLEPGTEQVIKGARIQGDSESGRLDGYSNENGLFERRVLPGRTDIWFLSPPTGFYVLDKDRVEVGDTVINAEGDVKEVTIYAPSKLYPLTTVRGKVLLPNGSPVGGVKISTSNSARYNGAGFHGSGGAYTGTNMDGTFELKDVPAGLQLFLYAQTKDYKYVLAENLRPLEGENNLAEPLIIQSGETAEVLFTDEKGNPRSNMKLKIQPMMWDSIIFRSDSRPIQTDSNGMVKVDGIVPGMKYFVCDAQMNRSRRNWSDTYFYQKVRLIPEDKQKTIKAVLSHNMIVNVTDSNGHIIPIKSIESLYILTPAGKRTRGRTINIEDRLSDGSVLINNKHLTSAKSEYEMEINVVTDKDKSVLAIGKFPDDASNRLTFVAHHGNDNKDHLLKQGAGKSVGQSPALQDEGKSKFVATLPNGVTVELVGVCEHPSKGKQWWRPDGKVIEEQDRPYEKLGFFAMTYPENKLFELAVRVKHAPTGDVGIISNLVRGTFLKCNNNTWGNTLDVKKTTEKVYINLGVATGPWKREAFSTAKFGRRRSRSPGFAFTEAYDTDKGYAAVTITHKKDIHKENYRVIAVDKDRQTYVADLYQNDKVDGMKQTTVHFKTLKADQIQHFEFQTRPYQWVTFKNVSLKTNSKTDVQIEVEKSNRQTNEKPAQAGPSIQDLLKVPQAHFDMLSQAYGKKNWQLANQAATELRDFFRQNDERIIQQFADSAESENIIELVAVVEELSGEVHDSIRDGKMYLIHAYYEELGKKWRELKNVPLKRVDQSPTLPIGYWNFDGDAKDSIGNNHGIVYGATLTEGISGQAYYFEGDGDCISVPDSDVFDFGADDFTLSAWFKMSILKIPFPFILNFQQNDNNPHIEIYAGVDLGTHIVPGFTRITYRDAGINDDKWHNVAITLENGEENGYRLYLDGIQVGKATYAGRLQDWDTITIGTQKKNSRDKFAFKGFIDEVAVYDKALSAEEIQNIYNTIQITEKPDRKTDVQVEENKTGETIARRLAKPVQRTSRLKQRTESMGRLRKIGLALVMYADDHKKYPDSLDKLKSYIQDDVLDWAQDNVAYFGRGKSITTDPQIAIAYDKTLLKKENSQGTNVLYSDTHVAFRKTKQLKQQGLVPKDKIAVPVETKNVEKTNWVVEDYGQTRLLSNKERPEVDWVSIIASVVKNNGCYLVPDNGLTLKELIKAAGYNRDKLDESYVTVSREIKQGSQRAFKLYSRNLETLFSGKESNIPLKHGDAIVGGFIEPSPNADEFWGRYHFGDVIELTVNDDNAKTNMFVDLDTAKLITPPETLDNTDENAVLIWIKENGIDVLGETADSVRGLVGFNIYATRVDNYFWDVDKFQITDRLLTRMDEIILLSADDVLPVTYLIKTSEHTMGVLQILGFAENPRGVKIRYKLLQKTDVPIDGEFIIGGVINQNGGIITGAEVGIGLKQQPMMIGGSRGHSRNKCDYASTDKAGLFSIPKPETKDYMIVVSHSEGYARIMGSDFTEGSDIVIQPWGRIEGKFIDRVKTGSPNKITICRRPFPECPRHYYDFQNSTYVSGSEGKFVFEQVMDGWVDIGNDFQFRGPTGTTTNRVGIEVLSNRTTNVIIGGGGRPVIGKFKPPEGYPSKIDYRYGMRLINTARPDIEKPDGYNQFTEKEKREWDKKYYQTDKYKTMMAKHCQKQRYYAFNIEDDGSFRIESVMPGKYRFLGDIEENPSIHKKTVVILCIDSTFEVPSSGDGSYKPYDLGEITLRIPHKQKSSIGSKLEFRVVVKPEYAGLSEKEISQLKNEFNTNGVKRIRRGENKFQWFEARSEKEFQRFIDSKYQRFIIGEYQGRKYMLLYDDKPYVMLSGQGWGLQKAEAVTDPVGNPAVAFEFDETGTVLFGTLTASNLKKSLAIIVDDKVYSAPTVETKIQGKGQISGIFSEEEVSDLTKTLKIGMPTVEPSPTKPRIDVPGEGVGNKKGGLRSQSISEPMREVAVGNKAKLRSGLEVELLGLTYLPMKGQPWWKPDGSPLVEPPFDRVSYGPVEGAEREQFDYYAIAVKQKEKPKGEIRLIKWHFTNADYAGSTSAYLGNKRMYNENILAAAARFPKNVETTTLQLGIASGEWQTLAAGRHHGFYKNGKDSIMVRMPEKVGSAFGLMPGMKGLQISVTYNITDRDFRVVAVDKDNKVHFSSYGGSGGTKNLRRTTARFPGLAREQLKEYRFEVRPYEWIEFKDIVLRPGKNADAIAERKRIREQEQIEKWLGRGQTRHIRKQILVLRECRHWHEPSEAQIKVLSAMRELVHIGSPAVPELTAELQQTEKRLVKRMVAFVLRAIGDPKAVPVLIDVLGKSRYSGLMGFHVRDDELARFMLDNQHRPPDEGGRKAKAITLGCPVIEITSALEKITGHSEGHGHYANKAITELGRHAPRDKMEQRIQEIVREV